MRLVSLQIRAYNQVIDKVGTIHKPCIWNIFQALAVTREGLTLCFNEADSGCERFLEQDSSASVDRVLMAKAT